LEVDTRDRARVLTLGEVIDGFFHLSDSDKAIFSTVIGRAVGGPTTTVNSVETTANAVVPSGHTRDPKTGKVFKLVPKKNKTQERIRLENNLASAKKEWASLVREVGFTLTEEGFPDPPIEDPVKNSRALELAKALGEAKEALASYKEAHPEEFAPPPNKGKGKTGKPVSSAKADSPAKAESSGKPEVSEKSQSKPGPNQEKKDLPAPLGVGSASLLAGSSRWGTPSNLEGRKTPPKGGEKKAPVKAPQGTNPTQW